MTNENLRNEIKAQLMELAQQLIGKAALAGDTDILMIATALSTAIVASNRPESIADLSRTMAEFCGREIARQRGESEESVAVAELLRGVARRGVN